MTELQSLVGNLSEQLSSCQITTTEMDAEVDKMVMEGEEEINKNKHLDGLMENCVEDKMNITRVYI